MFSECFGQDVILLCKADSNTLDNSRRCNQKKKRELEYASQVLNFLDSLIPVKMELLLNTV